MVWRRFFWRSPSVSVEPQFARLPALMTDSHLSIISIPLVSTRGGTRVQEQLHGRLGPALVAATLLERFELRVRWPRPLIQEVLDTVTTHKTSLQSLFCNFWLVQDLQDVILPYLVTLPLKTLKFRIARQGVAEQHCVMFLQQVTHTFHSRITMLHSLELFNNFDEQQIPLPLGLQQILQRNQFLHAMQQGPTVQGRSILGAALGRVTKDASSVYKLIRHKSTFVEELNAKVERDNG